MRGGESGTSVIQVKKGRCVIGIMGGNDKQEELRKMLEET